MGSTSGASRHPRLETEPTKETEQYFRWNCHYATKVLARRVSSSPMDAHFWKKHKENSPNLLYVYGKTYLLDGQFSMSG